MLTDGKSLDYKSGGVFDMGRGIWTWSHVMGNQFEYVSEGSCDSQL